MSDDTRNPRILDQDLHDLQVLDPAHDARPSAGREPAAQALLARILDEPQGGASGDHDSQTGVRRRWRPWALAGAAAAVLAVGLVAVPQWGTPEHAFATWTPEPEQVPASQGDLGEQCTNSLAREMLGTQTVIAEERGRVSFVVTISPYNHRHCLFVDGERSMTGSGSLRGRPAEVSPTEVQTFQVTGSGRGDDAYTAITGRVGEDVVGVEVHPRGPVTEPGALSASELPESITATVSNGLYGAWWPGSTEEVTLTIHLADGTVLRDVPAFDH